MTNTEANTTALTLREIADVLDAGGDPSEEFEQSSDGHSWHLPDDCSDLIDSIGRGWQVRRKPKTVRVSGDISREVISWAQFHAMGDEGTDVYKISRALLSLVEDDHD